MTYQKRKWEKQRETKKYIDSGESEVDIKMPVLRREGGDQTKEKNPMLLR